MTISFDAFWLPLSLTVIALGWAAWIFQDSGRWVDPFFTFSVAVAWPAMPVLAAWLIWALLV